MDHRALVKVFIRFLTRLIQACTKHKIQHAGIQEPIVYSLFDMALHCKWTRIERRDTIAIIRLVQTLPIITKKSADWIQNCVITAVLSPWTRENLAVVLHGERHVSLTLGRYI